MVLRISTQLPVRDVQKTKKAAASSSGSFSIESAAISSPKTMSPLIEAHVIQQDDSPKKRGLKKGKSLLDALDQLRVSLISGNIPDLSVIKEKSVYTDEIEDEKLQNILSEIETRAAVELAKLGVNHCD